MITFPDDYKAFTPASIEPTCVAPPFVEPPPTGDDVFWRAMTAVRNVGRWHLHQFKRSAAMERAIAAARIALADEAAPEALARAVIEAYRTKG